VKKLTKPAQPPREERKLPGLPQSRPPLERMMRIHALVSSGRHLNAHRLAEDLEVSRKTVLRDVEFMRDRLSLPIEYDPVRGGYHYTGKVEAFPTLQITEGELFALLVAEKALQQYRGTPYEKPLLAALRKLERTLPDTVSLNFSDWEQSISFRTSATPVQDLPLIDTLARAAAAGSELRLLYRKPNRQPEERIVHPYHVANVNGDWYLFAFDRLRNAVRTFAPARITKATPTGKSFPRPTDFNLDQLLRDSFGIHSTHGEFDVVVRFAADVADYIREKRWHPSQQLRELADGGVEIQLRLGSLIEVKRWILGWGASATVLAPDSLRADIQQTAAALASAYSS
jgi:predicted DNA-binding transcriptional regulator YafY